MGFKSELLNPKKEKSPTCSNFEFFEHFQDFKKVDYRSWNKKLLGPKKEKSPTCSNFKIFEHDPQRDMKFLNP